VLSATSCTYVGPVEVEHASFNVYEIERGTFSALERWRHSPSSGRFELVERGAPDAV
jgi:hypothetical protein